MTERVAGYNDNSILCACGDIAFRVPVYKDQFTITETGAVYGSRDRQRRDHAGEMLEGIRQRSVEVKRETGREEGPMRIRDWEL